MISQLGSLKYVPGSPNQFHIGKNEIITFSDSCSLILYCSNSSIGFGEYVLSNLMCHVRIIHVSLKGREKEREGGSEG